jgi:hypothetical protein
MFRLTSVFNRRFVMKKGVGVVFFAVFFLCGCISLGIGQTGPFDPTDWPETVDPDKTVHYWSADWNFWPIGGNWLENELQLLDGGDQETQAITIGGYEGIEVLGNFLNVADFSFEEWADDEYIDILVQVYGNAALLNTEGEPRNFTFLTGVLPDLNWPVGGSIPVTCKNQQWNWILFRVENGLRPDETRFVGSIPANAQGAYSFGGVNGGTIRFEGVPGLIVRLVAFGEQGAFGEPEQINVCSTGQECPPEPETNHAWIDIASDTNEHMQVINGGDQTVEFVDNVGPAEDQRRAVRPLGSFMNFGVTDYYLGEPCNEPHAVKICLEFYDDPALAGAVFGPEAYALDASGGIGFVDAGKRQVLAGTGTWVRRSWSVPSVNLFGVNTTPLTGGPRLYFEGGQVCISRFDLAVMRVGDHPLAGEDPLADCYADPNICTGAYGSYVVMDLGQGVEDGLSPGTSGGDQEMIIEDAGPASDRRMAIRPAFDDGSPAHTHQFINLAITEEALGPNSQPNAHLAICVTYYDDPALAGATFRPEVYQTEQNGILTFGFYPGDGAVALAGTDQWRTAYFEIPQIKFIGVNQGPQAAARFTFSDKIFLTRVEYAVIRPCGPDAGVNLLADCQPLSALQIVAVEYLQDRVALTFPTQENVVYRLESRPDLSPDPWQERLFALTVDGAVDQPNILGTGDEVTIFVELPMNGIKAEFFQVVGEK